jgi:hypothetical protein
MHKIEIVEKIITIDKYRQSDKNTRRLCTKEAGKKNQEFDR